MNLLVIRHAIALDAAEWARDHADDAGRPLTPEGRKKMKKIVRGLRHLVPTIDVLATSPFTRAAQTADIVATGYGGLEPVTLAALAPGQSVTALSEWLDRQRRHDSVAVVGHEPSLSRSVSWLLAGAERSFIEIKKGAVCLLRLEATVTAASATLVWALMPSQLRNLPG
jgi:phosphohistidine phosphatase